MSRLNDILSLPRLVAGVALILPPLLACCQAKSEPGAGTPVTVSPCWTAGGEGTHNRFGYAVATAGDVNGDGCDDVIVGAYHHANFRGRAYVYTGGRDSLAELPSFVLAGEGPDSYFGRSVAAAGDVDGDGYDDVIVGAPNHDGNTGQAYLYTGGAGGLDAAPSLILDGEEPNNWYGHAVGVAGDVDGDGHPEVIVGAYGYGDWTGRAYLPCIPEDP